MHLNIFAINAQMKPEQLALSPYSLSMQFSRFQHTDDDDDVADAHDDDDDGIERG